ncbi:MAG TPA: type II toxin-antitoxin system PemK/MazF family toxin [Candidatus Paceibacterota bacterium]
MNKDFDSWNKKKKEIHAGEFNSFVHEREIWWCALGTNIGDETDGKNETFERPVLVLKKFNRDIVLIVPLTTKVKDNKYYFPFVHKDIKFAVVLSQLRLISTKRLNRRVRKIDHTLFKNIKQKIIEVSITP